MDFVNVKSFNAKGDSLTDDTAAIEAAINYVIADTNGGILYFPPGVYRANISVPECSWSKGLQLIGSGIESTVISNYDEVVPVISKEAITSHQRFFLRDMTVRTTDYLNDVLYISGTAIYNIYGGIYDCRFQGPIPVGGSYSTANLINLHYGQGFNIENTQCYGALRALNLEDSYYCHIHSLDGYDEMTNGIRVHGGGNNTLNHIYIDDTYRDGTGGVTTAFLFENTVDNTSINLSNTGGTGIHYALHMLGTGDVVGESNSCKRNKIWGGSLFAPHSTLDASLSTVYLQGLCNDNEIHGCKIEKANLVKAGYLCVKAADYDSHVIYPENNIIESPVYSIISDPTGAFAVSIPDEAIGNKIKFQDCETFKKTVLGDTLVSTSGTITLPTNIHENVYRTSGVSSIVYNLPLATLGTKVTFINGSSGSLRIDPNIADSIRGGSGAGYYAQLSTLSNVTLLCNQANMWDIIGYYGTITFEIP